MPHEHRPNYRYVVRDVATSGQIRWYYRPPGRARVRLPDPSDPSFENEYKIAANVVIADPSTQGFVYFLREEGGPIKIGFTTKPGQRFNTLSTGSGRPVDFWIVLRGSQNDEHRMHKLFSHLRVKGEWFRAVPDLRRALARMTMFGLPAVLDEIEAGAAAKSNKAA